MKVQLMSDLHLEFHRDHGISFFKSLDPKDVDVLVLAGDITVLRDYYWAQDTFSELCALYKNVVYVQGNHEYYSTDVGTAEHHLNAIEVGLSNLHVLRHGSVKTIDGQRFIGGTLWFGKEKNNRIYAQQMNDFHVIGGFDPWVYEQNELTIQGFQDNLCEGDVVVTHHLPSQKSVHQKFRMSSLNRFFVCDVEDIIVARKPKLWLHGHTHEACDYVVGSTRVVANPHGYPHEDIEIPFNPKLVIDV